MWCLSPGTPSSGSTALRLSLGSVKAHQHQRADGLSQAERGSALAEFIEETNWHKMVGKKVRLVDGSLMTRDAAWLTVLLAINLEGVETMSTWHFMAESAGHLSATSPRVFDLLWPEQSPATLVLQYLSTLLDRHPLTTLLCRLANTTSVQELLERCPEKGMQMRASFIHTHGWSYIRHVYRFRRLEVLAVADHRRPLRQRMDICINFKKGHCRMCHRATSFRKVYDQISEPDDLLRADWQFRLFTTARLVSGANSECELTHAQNNKTFNEKSRWDYFAARAFCREQHTSAVAQADLGRLQSRLAIADLPPAESQPARAESEPAAPLFNCVKLWWHWFSSKRDKAAGRTFNPSTKKYWDECEASWEALSDEEKVAHNELWEADSAAARSAKADAVVNRASIVERTEQAVSLALAHVPLAGRSSDGQILGLDPRHYAEFCRGKKTQSCTGRSAKKHAAEFRRFVHGFARDRGHMAARVIMPATCAAACHATGADRLRLFRAMRDKLPRRVKECGGKKACQALQVLLSFTPLSHGHRQWCLVTDQFGAGVNGVYAAAELVLEVVDADPGLAVAAKALAEAMDMPGHILELRRHAFIEHREAKDSVLALHSFRGPLHTRLLTEWIAEMLPLETPLSDITLRRHHFYWSQLSLDILVATGEDATFEPTVFSAKRVVVSDSDEAEDDWVSLGKHKAHASRAPPAKRSCPNAPPGLEDRVDAVSEDERGVIYEDDATIDSMDPVLLDPNGPHITSALADEAEKARLELVGGPSDAESSAASEGEDEAAPVAPRPNREELDERLFARDWRQLVVEHDHATSEVWEKRGAERVQCLGTAKWVGLQNVSLTCKRHSRLPGFRGRCGDIWRGTDGTWEVVDSEIERWFAMSACYRDSDVSAERTHHMNEVLLARNRIKAESRRLSGAAHTG